MYFISAY